MSARYREILSYTEMTGREGLSLQKGMNFRIHGGAAGYSIILMSVRKNAPYQDRWHEPGSPEAVRHGAGDRGVLEYEGHDLPKRQGSTVDPKKVDQPLTLPGGGGGSGRPTDNGKFYAAAMAHKADPAGTPPEIVQVYEKIADGIWCDRGRHELVDAAIVAVPITKNAKKTRNVIRFFLRPCATPAAGRGGEDERELSINRQIPTAVKVAVWKRDGGRCVTCGASDNLHFDHDVPFSKGGSSITVENVKLLCARHNLSKSDKIISLGPLLGPLVFGAVASMARGA